MKFASAIKKIGSGLLVAKLITIVMTPVVTRLYSPSAYGYFATVMAVGVFLFPLLNFKISSLAPVVLNGKKRKTITIGAILLTLYSTFFLMILTFFPLLVLINLNLDWRQGVIILAFAIPVACVMSINESLQFYNTACKKYGLIAFAVAVQAVASEALKVSWALLCEQRAFGLVLAVIVAYLLSIYISIRAISIADIKSRIRHLSIRSLISRHIDFPKYRLPAQIALSASINVPVPFVLLYYGPEKAGLLGLSLTILSAPMAIVGQAVSKAFYGEVASNKSRAGLLRKSLNVSIILLILYAPVIPIIFVFGEPLFGFVFGLEWSEAASLAKLISIYVLFQFITSPFLEIFNLTSDQKKYLLIYSFRLIAAIVSIVISVILKLDILNFLSVYVFFLSLSYVLNGVLIYFSIKKLERNSI